MADGIYAALSGAIAQARALDVISNNMANASTTGFKRDDLVFKEIFKQAGANPDVTHRQVVLEDVVPNLSQGSLKTTGNPLDVALEGEGFFVVQTSGGERLTRAGSFNLDPAGTLVDAGGNAVLGDAGPIVVPPEGGASIDVTGNVLSRGLPVGKLRVVNAETGDLIREGNNLWRVKDGSTPTPVDSAHVESGSIEGSNVSVVASMSELIWVTRVFESFQNTIETFRSIDQKTANEIKG